MKIKKFTLKFLLMIISCILISTSFLGCTIKFNSASEDVEAVNNLTKLGIMSSCVTVLSKSDSGVVEGSGGIIKAQELSQNLNLELPLGQKQYSYFVITNNHVVYQGDNFIVLDCYGNKHSAKLISKNADYDLAILKFTSTQEFSPLKIKKTNASIGDKIIAIGTPLGQVNTVTLGKVLGFSTPLVVEDEFSSNVTFNVIKHSAPIYSGSSGGVLLDYEYNIVGINYANSADNETLEFYSAYAIPCSEVLNFISLSAI